MLSTLLLQAQALGPEACILSGLCAAPDPGPRIPSGIMFTAIGLVGLGILGLRLTGRRGRSSDPATESSAERHTQP